MTVNTPGEAALPHPDEADDPNFDESLPRRELQRLVGGPCGDCGTRYSAREAVFSILLGLKNAPRCLPCISRRLGRDADDLRSDLVAQVHRRDCYLKAWREAERIDGVAPTGSVTVELTPPPASPPPSAEPIPTAVEWDAGGTGCGELVMALRMRLAQMKAGEVMRVTATDPAAPEDLPAWCRLCGHTLVAMDHPHYWIRRKGD